MPRTDRLSEGGVKLLQEKQLAIVATVMSDGSPQTTPVWVDVEPDDSHILINTVAHSDGEARVILRIKPTHVVERGHERTAGM